MRSDPIRVFVVEAEWLYREAVVSTLSSAREFEIGGQSENGETALARMLADPPQIALVDVDLPESAVSSSASACARSCPRRG